MVSVLQTVRLFRSQANARHDRLGTELFKEFSGLGKNELGFAFLTMSDKTTLMQKDG